ncbi:MAG TPA: hypothetical protein VGM98_10795, partial [Schlesneria sp.]
AHEVFGLQATGCVYWHRFPNYDRISVWATPINREFTPTRNDFTIGDDESIMKAETPYPCDHQHARHH